MQTMIFSSYPPTLLSKIRGNRVTGCYGVQTAAPGGSLRKCSGRAGKEAGGAKNEGGPSESDRSGLKAPLDRTLKSVRRGGFG